ICMHIAPRADVRLLFFEIPLVFLDEEEAIPELCIAFLVSARCEMLRHEWRIDTDEVCALQRSSDRKVAFSAATKSPIKAAQTTKRVRSHHERTASQHAPRMPTAVLQDAQQVVGHYRARWCRIYSADANGLTRWIPVARSYDKTIRVAKGCYPAM